VLMKSSSLRLIRDLPATPSTTEARCRQAFGSAHAIAIYKSRASNDE